MSANLGPVSREAVAAAETRVRPPEFLGSAFATAGLLLLLAGVNVILIGADIQLPVPVVETVMLPCNALLGLLVDQPRDLFAFLPSAKDGLAPVLLDILAVVVAGVVVYVVPVHAFRHMRFLARNRKRGKKIRALEPDMPEFEVRVAHDPYEAELEQVLGKDPDASRG